MIEVINRQRKIPLSGKDFIDFAAKAFESVSDAEDSEVTVVFVSNERIRKLNRDFRDKNSPTDVLSFPLEEEGAKGIFGDVVISAERAREQARENGMSLETELRQLILHGLLHLAGYDHESDDGTMDRLELQLRKELNIE